MKYVQAYVVALVIFLVLDFAWLSTMARTFYASRIGDMMLDQPRWGVAAIFYLVYVVGIVYFAVLAGLAANSAAVGALNGALLGFFAYLTYNATNLSVMKGYDTTVAIVDTAWGTLLGALVAGGAVWVLQRFGWGS